MNRGIYIQILENDKFHSKWDENRIFWNESSDIYTFLRNHTLKIEHKFDTKFNAFSDNEIPMDGIKMLADGIKKDLDFLIEEYESKPIESGLNPVILDYNGKQIKLHYKASKLHRIILNLVRFQRKLESVIEKNKKVYVCGNAYFNDKMLDALMKIRSEFRTNGIVSVNGIQETELTALIKDKSLIKTNSNYRLTRKGMIIDIAE
ncbi:hypothetical protein BXY85_3591 [Roseivirga pacifica]|uniref:Uncharacterized protein n=1 Tax=Roseivirga pacifica TaxID=1267423 RepID=A0A1I0QFM3_9BACT|nr:hypothetical protein [Roseivirga pacifica]RKQ42973.1 hypothetical protein BXY85_3591 [Roseivirga pacifica]SEW25759.1 hypothetical protein SAMN05216290_2284 [Roseivirga pacifica]